MNNLWIRTQDRTALIRSYEIYISEQCNCYLIRAKRTSHILGSYKTFERALEILDIIQKLLTPAIISKPIVKETTKPQSVSKTFEQIGSDFEIRELNTIVFEMPKE